MRTVVALAACLFSFILAVGLCFWALGIAAHIIVIAFFLAYLLYPVALWLERHKIPRTVAVLGSILMMLGLFALGLVLVIPPLFEQLQKLAADFPQIFHSLVTRLQALLEHYHLPWALNEPEFIDKIKGYLEENIQKALRPALFLTGAIVTSGIRSILLLAQLALFPVFFFYILNQYESLRAFWLSLIPPSKRKRVHQFLHKVNEVLGAFVRGQLLDSTALAFLYSCGLAITGIPFGFLVGLLSGFLSVIPYVGTALGIFTSLCLALAYDASAAQYIGIGLTFGIGQAVESFLIQPKVVGNKVGLGPISTLLLVIAGGNLGGMLGILLAIPLGGILRLFLVEALAAYKASHLYR